MNKSLKQFLFASVAGAALAAGVSIGSAKAFSDVDWSFELSIDPCISIDVDLDPSSMTTIEADQKSVGDIEAISVVKDIEVKQPRMHGEGDDEEHHVRGLDALTQLGLLVSSATAVANNASVTTNTQALFADITQNARGADFYDSLWILTPQGEVEAKSIVKDIDNLQIDSSATAVSNNASLTSVVSSLGDTTVVGNVKQTSHMDVTAVSVVKDIDLSNYTNLGKLKTPAISSVATAVGNNLNVSVTKAVPTP